MVLLKSYLHYKGEITNEDIRLFLILLCMMQRWSDNMQWMRCPCDKIYKMADIGDFLQQYIQSDVFYRIIKKNSDRTFDLMVLIRRADGGVYEERCIYNISSYHFSFIAKNNISME